MDIFEISAALAAQHRAELQDRAERRRLLREAKAGSTGATGHFEHTRGSAIRLWALRWLSRVFGHDATPDPSRMPRPEPPTVKETPISDGEIPAPTPSRAELVEAGCGQPSRS